MLTGGCAVLILEALALLGVTLLAGAAINSAIHQNGSGNIQLPRGLPNLATRSDPCSPRPCLAHGGVTLLVGHVQRSADTVQVEVTFVSSSGTHTITPEEIAVRDSNGGVMLPGVDAAGDQCASASTSQDLQAGQRAGPFTICYTLASSASGPLTLVWIDPEDVALIELMLS